jgi:hypothetical protein
MPPRRKSSSTEPRAISIRAWESSDWFNGSMVVGTDQFLAVVR